MKNFICILLTVAMIVPMTVFSAPVGLGEYVITADTLNVRSEATADSDRLGVLKKGDVVNVLEISNGYWGRIKYNGSKAWISLNYAYATNKDGVAMTMSEEGLAMLKKLEGYSKMAYWDYAQWSIGYGTACGENEYPNGITEKEASDMLVKVLAVYESYLDAFLYKNSITVSQSQYDALVSFTYNLGNIWALTSKNVPLRDILIKGVSSSNEQEVRDAFGAHVTAGGMVNNGLIYRRGIEADMFLKGTSFCVGGFGDVKATAWYAEAVQYTLDKGYMHGMSATVFAPNNNVTREQFVLILANIAGVDTDKLKNKDSGMRDVPKGKWYSGAVVWAVEQGYVSGIAEGVFGTGRSIQRAALTRLLYLYAQKSGKNVAVLADLSGFADYSIVAKPSSAWMKEAMQWAVACEIITGFTVENQKYLRPGGTATRAQTARMLMQYDKAE